MNEKQLYRTCANLGIEREGALNLVLLKRRLKDATTIGYGKGVPGLLRENKFQWIMHKSYVEKKIHGFLEQTSSVPYPGAAINRRYYVGYGLHKEKLRKLIGGSDFIQGLLFGFPFCCNLSYCRKAAREDKEFVEILQDWIVSLPHDKGVKEVDYRLIGGVLKYLQPIRVIQHIPCSPACRESLLLAERNLSILGSVDSFFMKRAIEEFSRPVFIYGNSWENAQIAQLGNFKRLKVNRFSARCIAATDIRIPSGSSRIAGSKSLLTFVVRPFRKVEIFHGRSLLVEQSSSRPVPWSYCFLQPYDSLK